MALESIYEFEIKIFISTRVGNSEATTMQQSKKKDRRSSTSSRGVEENTSAVAGAAAAAAEWNAELERVADKFDKNDVDQHNVATVATVIQPLGEAFAALVPQLTRASEMVREELQVIRAKEDGDLLRERFRRQIDDYKQVSFIRAVTLHAALCFLQYH
jgi:hypothetical protein